VNFLCIDIFSISCEFEEEEEEEGEMLSTYLLISLQKKWSPETVDKME